MRAAAEAACSAVHFIAAKWWLLAIIRPRLPLVQLPVVEGSRNVVKAALTHMGPSRL